MSKTGNEHSAETFADRLQAQAAYVTEVERQAFYFGADTAPLFGWLHMPRAKPIGRMGMVLCPPLGVDFVSTYPVLRHLANRLAFHGIPVLRFDYSGMGNSSGSNVDADRVASWLNDIREARSTLARISGCTEVGLFGVRIGGLLAAAVAHDTALPCLALWGPVTRGRAYMREMRAMHLTAESTPLALGDDSNIEAGGFVFTPQTARDLTAISLDALLPKTERILFAARDDLPGDQVAPKSWVGAEQQTLPDFVGMMSAPHNARHRIPFAALDHLEDWLVNTARIVNTGHVSGSKALQPESLSGSARFLDRPSAAQATARESVFRFGDQNARFAIVTEPVSNAQPNAPWVIFSNSGADHTAGQNRLYVLLSRALAQVGICSVRFDFPGVGDSIVVPPEPENATYQSSNNTELASLITALQQHRSAQQFILMGLCSGAFASFHGALNLKQQPIVECILFNPLVFYSTPGMSLDEPLPIPEAAEKSKDHLNLWQYYLGRLKDVNSWKNLLTAKSDIGQVLRATSHRARSAFSEYFQSWTGKSAAYDHDPLTRDVRAIAESGRRLTFVFARSDPGYGILMTHAGAVVRYFMRRKRVRIWSIERTNHTFTGSAARADVVNSVVKYLLQTYGSAAAGETRTIK